MYKKRVLVLTLIISASSLGGAIMSDVFRAQRAFAQQEIKRAEAQRWDYCAITHYGKVGLEGGRTAYIATIKYYRGMGAQHEEVEGSNETDALSRAIAKLGDERWEMVNGGSSYNFKRSKP